MVGSDDDPYVAAFEARCAAGEASGGSRVERPGVRGLLFAGTTARTQLLVLDDRALGMLEAVLPVAPPGTIRVYRAARRCTRLLMNEPSWSARPLIGMVCSDLRTVPTPALPVGLSLRPVRRGTGDPPDGVLLPDAVATAQRAADPARGVDGHELLTHLASLPAGTRILAAVDAAGIVQGTSASLTIGTDAYVFFVNTDPGWRRRGVGLAMTASALRAAADTGAVRASLDASGPGAGIYRRLGFTAAAELIQFVRSG